MGQFEYSPFPRSKESEKIEQTAFEFRELGADFLKRMYMAREAIVVLENKGGWERQIKLFKENHPQYFKKEGLYSREDTGTVTVVARWKEKGEGCLIPLFWKVKKGEKALSLERIPYLSYKKDVSPKTPEKTDDPFKDSIRLSSENHRKIEDLIRKFVELTGDGKLVANEKEMEIILEPQEELSGDREGEETLDPRTEQPEPSYINPLKDNDENLYKKITIVDGRNPREKRIVFPLKEGEVIFVFKWTGKRGRGGEGTVKLLSKEGEILLEELPIGIAERLEKLAAFSAKQFFSD
jgi:hypothetical protein